jgi:beta-lactamase regulating signal transducer with metallopeptidase domain
MNLLHMSISAGLLVIIIVMIRVVGLNKLPKTAFLVLWGVALFRLLVPVAIPARFNLFSAFWDIINNVSPENTTPFVVENVFYRFVLGKATTGEISRSGAFFGIPPTTFIWLAGMVAFFIFFAIIYFKNHRELRFATLIRDNDFLNTWIAEHRHMRPIAIMQSDRILTPIAVGLIKPRIILSKSMDMSDTQLLSHVLIHEYYHIKRFDALWKMVLVCAVCIHWFNPLAWVMLIFANRDLELACDEKVIRNFGAETKTAYV